MFSRTEGDGRDIVFIHGWTMDHRDEMRTYEPIFATRPGWRRHYLDLPGMGQSPADPTVADMDGMLAAVLRRIGTALGERRFALAGTSAGGYLARGVVARLGARIDGVLLRVPLVVPADAHRDIDPIRPLLADAAVMAAMPEAERAALGEVLVQRPGYIAALEAKLREAVLPATALADDAFLGPIRQDPARYAFSFDVDAAIGTFPAPSLILAGRQDGSVGYRDAWRLLRHFPRATFAALDRAEHGMPIDQHEVFAALVRDWLDRVTEMAPPG